MKKFILVSALVIAALYGYSNLKNSNNDTNVVKIKGKVNITDNFLKSLKEQKDEGTLPDYSEHFDSINNLYSNYKYRVAFDAPDDWASDEGVSEHTIFRTYQPDSAITFVINVFEIKLNKDLKDEPSIWEYYQGHKDEMDYPYKVLIPKKFNSKVENFIASKSYIKNQVSLKRSYSYMVRDLDFEYSNTSILYQTYIDEFNYTFGLDVPTMYYNENPDYYESLFANIYILHTKDDINNILNKNK
jgi:hypothetical protein